MPLTGTHLYNLLQRWLVLQQCEGINPCSQAHCTQQAWLAAGKALHHLHKQASSGPLCSFKTQKAFALIAYISGQLKVKRHDLCLSRQPYCTEQWSLVVLTPCISLQWQLSWALAAVSHDSQLCQPSALLALGTL